MFRTLDPATAYDLTSSGRLYNIYERLITFDGTSPGQDIMFIS